MQALGNESFMQMCNNPTDTQRITLNALVKNIFKYKNNLNNIGCNKLYEKLRKNSSVWANGEYVSDLSPLIYFTNIKKIAARNSKIVNLSPLSYLINLETIDLSSNKIKDISPLGNLKKLNRLSLYGNKIKKLLHFIN